MEEMENVSPLHSCSVRLVFQIQVPLPAFVSFHVCVETTSKVPGILPSECSTQGSSTGCLVRATARQRTASIQ